MVELSLNSRIIAHHALVVNARRLRACGPAVDAQGHRGTGAQGAATDGAAVRQAPKNDSPRGAVCGVPLLTLGVYNLTGRVPWHAPHTRRATERRGKRKRPLAKILTKTYNVPDN